MYQTPQVDLDAAQQDASNQRSAQKVQQLKAAVEQGYHPSQQEAQLIANYYRYDPKANTISDYGFWHTWGPMVMAVAGMAGSGVLAGTGALAGLGGTSGGLVPGLVDTAGANSLFAATPLAAAAVLPGGGSGGSGAQQQDGSATTEAYGPPNPYEVQPGEGWSSTGKIGVPDSLSNAGLTNSATTTATHGVPGWVKPVAGLAVPAALQLRGQGGTPTTGSGNGLDPTQSSQMSQLMQLLIDHAQRAAPVHQAAMDLALRLAPHANTSPQMQSALAASQTPRPQTQTDPQVLDAIHRLMSGGQR